MGILNFDESNYILFHYSATTYKKIKDLICRTACNILFSCRIKQRKTMLIKC